MMKKKFKKGFTLVELVIVIAVIAVLAAVLIPTFAGVVSKSKQSAALQTATTATTVMLVETDGTPIIGSYISVDGGKYWFKVATGNGLESVKKDQIASIVMNSCYAIDSKIAKDLSTNVVVYSIVNPVDSAATAQKLTVNAKGEATLAAVTP